MLHLPSDPQACGLERQFQPHAVNVLSFADSLIYSHLDAGFSPRQAHDLLCLCLVQSSKQMVRCELDNIDQSAAARGSSTSCSAGKLAVHEHHMAMETVSAGEATIHTTSA